MALVNLLRFNEHMGGIISDEEYWDVRFRRRLYCDNLHSLLDDKLSYRWDMNVVYGGVGYPSVHREVVTHVRKELSSVGNKQKSKKDNKLTLRDVARISFNCLQEAIRRRIDQKLRFYFGLTTQDINRGEFEHGGKLCKINNTKILDTARSFLTRDKTDPLLKAAMECKAAVFGYDSRDGIMSYYLSVEKSICGFNYEGFDSIGAGKYASGLSFGQKFNTKTLAMRKAGFGPAEGVYELVASALLASDFFKEVGGTMNFVIIDGSARKNPGRYREVFDEIARLTGEIVRASKIGLISRETSIQLIDKLVIKGDSFQKVETMFFKKVKDITSLQFLLRGYKYSELPGISMDINKSKMNKL